MRTEKNKYILLFNFFGLLFLLTEYLNYLNIISSKNTLFFSGVLFFYFGILSVIDEVKKSKKD